jgi:hypothetical protein
VGSRAATTLYRPGTDFDESDLSMMFAAASVALVVTMGAINTKIGTTIRLAIRINTP